MRRFMGAALVVAVSPRERAHRWPRTGRSTTRRGRCRRWSIPARPARRRPRLPSDAIVLFDGKDLSKWRSDKDSGAAKWKVADGYMEVVAGTGRHPHRAGLRRRAGPRGVDGPGSAGGEGRAGPRQQRRVPDGPIRGPGARHLRHHQQDLRGRPGGRALRPVPAARERRASARPVADLRHRVPRPALRRRRARSRGRRG